jgi:hypothetical protein
MPDVKNTGERDFRFGSKADLATTNRFVRFVPFSGHIGLELLTSALCHEQTSARSTHTAGQRRASTQSGARDR